MRRRSGQGREEGNHDRRLAGARLTDAALLLIDTRDHEKGKSPSTGKLILNLKPHEVKMNKVRPEKSTDPRVLRRGRLEVKADTKRKEGDAMVHLT